MLKKKIIISIIAIMASISTATAAGMGPNSVPIHSMFDAGGSGDLTHTTRHSFTTGRVLNPKTAEANTYNSKINGMNGWFRTGSSVYKTPGQYTFTVPDGFTRFMVVGCGAGGKGNTQLGLQSVAASGGGGAGSCFSVVLTKPLNTSATIAFYVADANVNVYDTQLSNRFGYYHSILGMNGGEGGGVTWNSGFVDGLAGEGGSEFLMRNGRGMWTQANIIDPIFTPAGAKMVTAGRSGIGADGGTSKNKIWNWNYTTECHGGRGGDGITLYNTRVPVAAENGCVMVVW